MSVAPSGSGADGFGRDRERRPAPERGENDPRERKAPEAGGGFGGVMVGERFSCHFGFHGFVALQQR